MLHLRDYQERAIRETYARLGTGVRRIILQLATGGGKTICAVVMILAALRQGKRALFVAHRIELLDQAVAKLVLAGIPEDHIGVIRGNDPRTRSGATVQVASVASLKILPPADLVIIDEAHRSSAASYQKLFEGYPDAVVIGLTATPERLDGRPLDMYQEIVVVAQPLELAMEGHIMSPIVYSVDLENLPDLSNVTRTAGDYHRGQLSIAVNKRKIIGSLVDHWEERAEGRRTIASGVSIEHCKTILEEFLARKIPTEHIDGKTKSSDRKAIRERLQTGETLVVTQVDLWVEGIDIPEVKCAILGRPTESITVYLQTIGRILRPWNNVIPIVLDHSGNCRVHGVPMKPRQYKLTGRAKQPRNVCLTKTCSCFAVVDIGATVCEVCGHVFGPQNDKTRTVRTEDGFLIEVPQDEASLRQQFWVRIAREASGMGFKREWACYKFKERFGIWPPATFTMPERPPADDATRRRELTKLRAIKHRAGKEDTWVAERYAAMFGETPAALLDREEATRRQSEKPAISAMEEIDIGL